MPPHQQNSPSVVTPAFSASRPSGSASPALLSASSARAAHTGTARPSRSAAPKTAPVPGAPPSRQSRTPSGQGPAYCPEPPDPRLPKWRTEPDEIPFAPKVWA